MKIAVGTLVGILISSMTPAWSESHFNQLGIRAYALWDCAAFAMLTEDESEQANALFTEGLTLLRELVEAGLAGQLNEANTAKIPVGITFNLTGGPSVDFRLGYLWSSFDERAFEETKPDSDVPTDEEERALQSALAEAAFRRKNCGLLLR